MKIKRKILVVLIILMFICCSKVYATEFNTIMEDENIVVDSNIIEENENVIKEEFVDYSNQFSTVEFKDYSSAQSMVRIIAAVISIVRTTLVIIAIVFFIIAVVRYLKNKNEETRKPLIIWFLLGIVTFGFSAVLGIIKEYKPIIYLYPEKEDDVEVKLGKPEKLTCTYPKYKESWKVLAKPNGDLVYKENGRKLYSLYWEGKNTVKQSLQEGFIVKGEDVASFLEEKLAILGLNEREAEEFIIYWLPKMESNKYNFVRFETKEEIDEDMPLEITPKPDTVIRVVMVYKKILKPYDVKEQVLETPERKGFTVVEWGGTKI